MKLKKVVNFTLKQAAILAVKKWHFRLNYIKAHPELANTYIEWCDLYPDEIKQLGYKYCGNCGFCVFYKEKHEFNANRFSENCGNVCPIAVNDIGCTSTDFPYHYETNNYDRILTMYNHVKRAAGLVLTNKFSYDHWRRCKVVKE